MRKLDNTCLVCIDCYGYGLAISALKKSMEQIQFERVLFLTDITIEIEGVEVIQIPRINSKREYSNFVVKHLAQYIPCDYFCLVQADGYIIDGEQWDDEYYNYDYIGASWVFDNDRQVGNGGSSFRSKRLHEILANDDLIDVLHPEDQSICIIYKFYLEEKYGIKFAPVELADKYSYELKEPAQKTFSFHGNFHHPYKPHIVLKRSAAGGDIVLMEPIMRWYNDNGWQVVLDVPLQFFELYTQHDFFVKHISQIDKGRIKPEKMVNLDLSYESMPHQNYVKSYFEVCGIKNYRLSKPQLFPKVNNDTKLFQKYAVIHIDRRETKERNVYGIKWNIVQDYLEECGYTVIQIGKNDREACGTWINTSSVAMMKYIIAGCDLLIGVDSMPSNIAIAYNKPCVLFFGSVDPHRIHADLTNVEVIQGDCDNAWCWHIPNGTAGKECIYKETDKYLQCCTHGKANSKYNTDTVIEKINKLKS